MRFFLPRPRAAALRPLALGLLAPMLVAVNGTPPAAAQPGRMCRGDLTGPSVSLSPGQTGFGRVQGQPPLPLGPKQYVLSFDDGPYRATTPALLATLRRYCVEATFMMIGHRAAAQPDLVRAILADGHGIGSHSFDHTDFGKLSPDALHADILDGANAVEKAATGQPWPAGAWRLFRFPGASGLPPVPQPAWADFVRRNHLVIAGYDISPEDWRHDAPQAGFARLFRHLPDRGVIVMHDAQPKTLDLLPMVLDELRRRHARIDALALRDGDQPIVTAGDR